MWYKIKQGRHRAYPLSLGIHIRECWRTYEVMFTDSCKYDLGDVDNFDWNKGAGWSYGLHHENSIRWVWRYNKNTDKFEVSLYNYIDSVLQVREDFIEVEGNLMWNIDLYNSRELKESGLIVTRVDRKVRMLKGDYLIPKIGYSLGAFFGGNESATYDMDLWIKRLKNNWSLKR